MFVHQHFAKLHQQIPLNKKHVELNISTKQVFQQHARKIRVLGAIVEILL